MRAIILLVLLLTLPLSVCASSSITPPIVPIQIVIDPGHGGIDSGATYEEIEEKNINLSIALQLYNTLVKKGYYAILTRERDEALSDTSPRRDIGSRHHRDLVQRGDIIKQFYPQLVISLHVNAGSKTKRGGLVLYHENAQGYLLAHIVQQKLNRLAQTNEVPHKNQSLYILNHSKTLALVVELGFISNPEERSRLLNENYQQQITDALAESIDEFMLIFPWSIILR